MRPGHYPCVNTEADAAPPGCAMEPVGDLDSQGRVRVRKPTGDDRTAVFVNGLGRIAPGEVGECVSPYPGAVFGVSGSDTLAARDSLGTKAGDWFFRKGQKGFLFVGGDAGGTRFGNMVPDPVSAVPPPPSPPPPLATRNTDGTQIGTTADMRFANSTGVRIDQGASFDTVSCVAATNTQMGAVTTTTQIYAGEKRFGGAVVRTANTNPAAATYDLLPWSRHDVTASSAFSEVAIKDPINPYGYSNPTTKVRTEVTTSAGLTEASVKAFPVDTGGTPTAPTAFMVSAFSSSINFAYFFASAGGGDASIQSTSDYAGTGQPAASLGLAGGVLYRRHIGGAPEAGIWRCTESIDIETNGRGFLVRSPSGARWRITVDNSGNIGTTPA